MPFDLLLGRKTFDNFAPFWRQHNDIWPAVNTATKYVASNTMTSHEWQPSVFLNGDIAEKVAKLKQEQGPDLHVWGSGSLLQTLIGRGERILTVLYSRSRGNSFGYGRPYFGESLFPRAKPEETYFHIDRSPRSQG